MKTSLVRLFGLFLAFSSLTPAFASLNLTRLQDLNSENSTNFDSEADALVKAISLSIHQPQNRSKLAGAFQPYSELSYRLVDVDDAQLFRSTSNFHSPASFHGISLKGGIGLPLGANIEAGFTQVVSEHKISGAFINVGAQIFDFSREVYTDIVPTLTANGSLMRTTQGPSLYNASMQLVLGDYHRIWHAQVGYVFQTNYSVLSDSVSHQALYLRHGLTTMIPLFEDIYLRTDLFAPTISGSMTLGYQF